MTDTYTGAANVEDIEDDVDTTTADLERQADEILAEGRTYGVRPLRLAVREDAAAARDWGRTRTGRLRHAVEEDPVKATLYALGIGVVIGLLAAR